MFENTVITNEQLPNPLTNKEICELFKEMKNGNKEARNKIILHNLRLVFHKLKDLKLAKYDEEEILSVGIMGLINAVDTFDLSKKINFSTYAYKCIHYEILVYFRKEKKHSKVISFEKPVTEDNHIIISSIIRDNYDLVEDMNDKEIKQILVNLVNNLDELEKEITLLYFGFYGKQYNQREIAKKLSVSQAFISQKIKRILQRLKVHLKVEPLTKTK